MAALETLLARLRMGPVQPSGAPLEGFDWLADKDRPVLASAIRLRCDVLVTGDRTRFGQAYGNVFGGVAIHSPRSLAEVILGSTAGKPSIR